MKTELTVDRWLLLAATVAVLWWVAQYTLSSPWWKDNIGRSFVYKDMLLLLILVPSCLIWIWPHMLTRTEGLALEGVVFGGIALVVGSRCVSFWRIQRPAPVKMWRALRHRNGHRRNGTGPQPKIPA